MKINWNFLGGGRGGGCKTKNLPWGEYGYFLEPHNVTLTLKMTTAQVVETSVTVTNSCFQNYTHPDNHTRQTTDTPGFKPFTRKPYLLD